MVLALCAVGLVAAFTARHQTDHDTE